MSLALPVLLYTIFLLPFLKLIPYSDGSTEFRVAYNFYNGHYFTNWIPYHPPLKPIISSIFFFLFGPQSYTFIGFLLGIAGVIGIYYIALKLYDKNTARLSAFFLALSGLYVSTSLFSLNDFIMAVFILVGFAFYTRKRYALYALFISLAVCAKETAILFPFSALAIEIYSKKYTKWQIVPFLVLTGWIVFLYSTGHTLWNSWNFSEKNDLGIHGTIFHNITSLALFNRYAYTNWLHVFFFNYNWFFWLIILFGIKKLKFDHNLRIISLFFFLYVFLVLTIQTYAITRYIIPLMPFVYLYTAHIIMQSKYKIFLIVIAVFISLSSLFTSDDPISNEIWGKSVVYGQAFYVSPYAGNDGITYNMQYFFMIQNRDVLLRKPHPGKSNASLHIDPETIEAYQLKK